MAKSKTPATDAEPAELPVPKGRPKAGISRADFTTHATPLVVRIGEQSIVVNVKQFSTGSFGWYGSTKLVLTVDGKPVTVQVSVQAPVVGSKDTLE